MRNSNKSPGFLSSLIGMTFLLFIVGTLSSLVRYAPIIIVIAIVIFLIYKLITFISMKISERKNSIEYEYYSEEFEDDYGDSEYDLEYSEEYGAENHGYLSVNDLQERYHISYDRANEIMNFIEQLNLVSKKDSSNLRVLLCDKNVIWYYIEGSFEDCIITSEPETENACPMPVETTTQNVNSSKDEKNNFSEIKLPEKSDVESQISPETTTQNRKTYNFKNCTRYVDIETFARACNTLLHKEDMQEWYGTSNTSNQSDDIPLAQHAVPEEENNITSEFDFEHDCADLSMKKEFFSIYEEYAIEMLLGGYLKGHILGNGYIMAFMYECQITNPERLDYWLLENGYLKKPSIQESLTRYKVPELKQFLAEKGMKVTGKKSELIDRLISSMSEQEITSQLNSDNRYFLSRKGIDYYYDNIDLEELHKNWKYGIGVEAYFKYRKVNGEIRGFYEAAYLALKEKIENGILDIASPNRITSFDFSNFSEVCEKLGKNDDAIHSMLIKLYIDVNLIGSFRFDKDLIELNGIDTMCDGLDVHMIFNLYTIQRIVMLSKFYSPSMVDDIYANFKWQYMVFDKENFKLAIDDMLQSAYFNASPYMSIIRQNYREICTNILKNKLSTNYQLTKITL